MFFILIANNEKTNFKEIHHRSDVQSNDLSRGYLKFLVDAGLEVLVEEGLELFVLLVEHAGVFDQVLPGHEHCVVLCECGVERLPHGKLLRREHSGELLPKHFLLALVALGLLLCALEVRLLLRARAPQQLLLHRPVLPVHVELLQRKHQVVRVQV